MTYQYFYVLILVRHIVVAATFVVRHCLSLVLHTILLIHGCAARMLRLTGANCQAGGAVGLARKMRRPTAPADGARVCC